MRILKYGLIGVATCLVLLLVGVGIVAWLLGTERGTAWLFTTLESSAAMEISVGDVRGTLLDGVVLTEIRLAFGNDRVTLASLTAQWDAMDLLRGAVTLDELTATGAGYFRGDPEPENASGGNIASPWRLIVRRGRVDSLVVESDGETYVLEDTSFALELIQDRLLARELATRVGDLEIRGRGELRMTQNLPVTAEFNWAWSTDDLDARGEGTLAGTLARLELHHELAEPFQLLTDGELLLGETLAADVDLEWTDLAWPGIDIVASPSGTMQLSGGLASYEFQGDGELIVDGIAAGFRAEGSGDSLRVFVETLALSTAGGDLEAEGEVRLEPLEWNLDIRAQELDPSLRFADWTGRLEGQARFEGRLEPALEWSAGEIAVTGTLRGYPLTGVGGVSFRSGAWELSDVELRSGPNAVTANGVVGDALMLDVTVDAPQAAALWPELSGALALEATIGGTFSAPNVEGSLEGLGLSWRDYEIDEVRVDASAAPGEEAPLALNIDARGLQWQRLTARSIEAHAAGLNGRHEIEIAVESEQWGARLSANGGLEPTSWSGLLNELTIEQSATGGWALTDPVSVRVGSSGVLLGDFCLAQVDARVCGLGRVSGATDDRIELAVTDFSLGTLRPFLPEALSIEGRYDAAVVLNEPLAQLSGTVSITGGPTRIAYEEGDDSPIDIGFDALNLDAMLEGDRLSMEGSLDGSEVGSANLSAEIGDLSAENPSVSAVLQASWDDIGFVSLLSPDVGDVSGELSLNVTVDGALDAPQVQGRAQLRAGALAVPAWGLSMRDIEADALSTDLRTVEFTAQGWAGEGRADLDGSMLLDPAAGWPTRVTLRGESLEVVRLPEAEVDLSPELHAEVALPEIRVTGNVHVPRAQLSLVELPAQAAAPSADAVVHGVEEATTFRPLHMQANLQLTLGEDVTYTGGGLTTSVSGDMNLGYESGQSANATGVVDLAGDYEISGQSLTLERGRLLFAGPLDNPGLDVRAVREIESRAAASEATTTSILQGQAGTVRVGVDLTGTLQAPQTRIFSEPAMSEADALSYLVFGRPLTGTGGAEAATLQSAAVSMGLRQALPVIQRVGESVGLDELTVQTTDADAGELMAGKFLSPRLYIRYTYGLFNRIGGLLLHFRLTDRLSLETRSGDEKSMDILYVVEKD